MRWMKLGLAYWFRVTLVYEQNKWKCRLPIPARLAGYHFRGFCGPSCDPEARVSFSFPEKHRQRHQTEELAFCCPVKEAAWADYVCNLEKCSLHTYFLYSFLYFFIFLIFLHFTNNVPGVALLHVTTTWFVFFG